MALTGCTCDSAANHETQAQAGTTKAVRPPEIPAAQHHRADVRLAEGEPQDWYSLRQAGKKFCRNGHAGLHAVVPTAVLFLQNLGRVPIDQLMTPSKQSIMGDRYTLPSRIWNSEMSVSHFSFGAIAVKSQLTRFSGAGLISLR